MYRDDHDAALARVAALEADLKRERADDAATKQKVATLEKALAKERQRLAAAEAELEKHRPPPPPEPRPATVPSPVKPEVRAATIVIGMIAAFVVIVGIGKCGRSMDKPETPVAAARRAVAIPDSISALLPELRERGEVALPGSRLLVLHAKGVTEAGTLHPRYGELEGTFQRTARPTRPEVDPSIPIGGAPAPPRSVLDDFECTYVKRTADAWPEHPLSQIRMCMVGDLRAHDTALEPRCTMASIWARAKIDGAPAGAIAEIRLEESSWTFVINDQRATFRATYPDDCE